MVRSAPPENASLPEVMTQPLMASSPATVSTICASSPITSGVITFMERPGMSQVATRNAVAIDLEAEIGEVRHPVLPGAAPVIPAAAKRRAGIVVRIAASYDPGFRFAAPGMTSEN